MKHRKHIKINQEKHYKVNMILKGVVDGVCKKIIVSLENSLLRAFGIDIDKYKEFKKENNI